MRNPRDINRGAPRPEPSRPNHIVPLVEFTEPNTPQKPGGMSVPKSGMDMFKNPFIIIIICSVIAFIITSFFSPRLSTYKADITRLETDLVKMRENEAELKSDLEATTQTASSAITKVTSVDSRLNTATSSLENATKSVNDAVKNAINTNLANYVTKEQLNTAVSGLSGSTSIKELQDSLKTVKDINTTQATTITEQGLKITALEKTVAELKAIIDAIKNPSTGTPTGETPSIQLTPNIFGQVNFVVSANVTSGQISFKLINPTAKQLTNIQLAAAFIFMRNDGTTYKDLPTGTSATLTTTGLNPVWTVQTPPDQHTLLFQTQTGTGLLSELYNFSQVEASKAYTLNLSLTGTAITDSYLVFPLVKIVSYQTK